MSLEFSWQRKLKKKVCSWEQRAADNLLDLAVVCLMSKETFLPMNISSSKAHAENAQAHIKSGRAAT